MGHNPDALGRSRRVREIVYVCDGIALGFMLGIPAAGLILGGLSWSLVLASVIGWATMIALATGIGRWIESDAGQGVEHSNDASGSDRALVLQ